MLWLGGCILLLATTSAIASAPFPYWSAQVANHGLGPVVLGGRHVYTTPHRFGTNRVKFALAAYNKKTGEKAFSLAPPNITDELGGNWKGLAAYDSKYDIAIYSVRGAWRVFAVQGSTGGQLWERKLTKQGDHNWMVHLGGGDVGLFFAIQRGQITCLNASDGSTLWNYTYYDDPDESVTSWAIHGDRVGITALNSYVIGLDVWTGGALYKGSGKNSGYTTSLTSTFYANGLIAAVGIATTTSLTSNNGTLVVFDANTGTAKWQYIDPCLGYQYAATDGTYATWTPSYDYGCSTNMRGFAATDGTQLWQWSHYWDVHSTVIHNGTAYTTVDKKELDFTQNLWVVGAGSGARAHKIGSSVNRFPMIVEHPLLFLTTSTQNGGGGSIVAIHI